MTATIILGIIVATIIAGVAWIFATAWEGFQTDEGWMADEPTADQCRREP